MDNKGAETTPPDDTKVIETHQAPPPPFSRTASRIQTDHLLSMSYIGDMVQRGNASPRYVTLKTNQIYTALVDIYALHFQAKWPALGHLLNNHPPPENVAPEKYLAQVYISHWFHDVYVSNKEACDRLDLARHSDYYYHSRGRNSTTYDNYLTLLLNMLKPTKINGLQADFLYVPVLTLQYDWTSTTSNFYRIIHHRHNPDLFSALLRIMKDPTHGWLLSKVASDPLGRPFWLFDWYNQDEDAFAWFPQEGNFNKDDQTVALILGVSCTPLLASRDCDFQQQYPDNAIPPPGYTIQVRRISDPRFHSNFDVRTTESHTRKFRLIGQKEVQEEVTETIQIDPNTAIVPTEAQATTPGAGQSSGQTPPQTRTTLVNKIVEIPYNYDVAQFRIIDYKYYLQVIRKADVNVRAAAHKILVYKD